MSKACDFLVCRFFYTRLCHPKNSTDFKTVSILYYSALEQQQNSSMLSRSMLKLMTLNWFYVLMCVTSVCGNLYMWIVELMIYSNQLDHGLFNSISWEREKKTHELRLAYCRLYYYYRIDPVTFIHNLHVHCTMYIHGFDEIRRQFILEPLIRMIHETEIVIAHACTHTQCVPVALLVCVSFSSMFSLACLLKLFACFVSRI